MRFRRGVNFPALTPRVRKRAGQLAENDPGCALPGGEIANSLPQSGDNACRERYALFAIKRDDFKRALLAVHFGIHPPYQRAFVQQWQDEIAIFALRCRRIHSRR